MTNKRTGNGNSKRKKAAPEGTALLRCVVIDASRLIPWHEQNAGIIHFVQALRSG